MKDIGIFFFRGPRNLDFTVFKQNTSTLLQFTEIHSISWEMLWKYIYCQSSWRFQCVYVYVYVPGTLCQVQLWSTWNANLKNSQKRMTLVDSNETGTRTENRKCWKHKRKRAEKKDDKYFCRHNMFFMMKIWTKTFEFNRESLCYDCMNQNL